MAKDDALHDDEIPVMAIEDSIDLHGFQPRDILSVVESYLEAAYDEGFAEVRLIHGKGKGVQRQRVRQLLEQHPLVDGFETAPGNLGATLVWFREPDDED